MGKVKERREAEEGGEAKERGEEKAGVRAGAGNQVTQKLKQ